MGVECMHAHANHSSYFIQIYVNYSCKLFTAMIQFLPVINMENNFVDSLKKVKKLQVTGLDL
jgi:hypothetical protein